MNNTHPISKIGDTVSAGAIVATFFGYLPYIAAIAGFIWYCIQIWESRTIQHWWRNFQMKRKARKIAKLRAKEKIITAQLEALEVVRSARAEAREKVENARVEASKVQLHDELTMQERLPPI